MTKLTLVTGVVVLASVVASAHLPAAAQGTGTAPQTPADAERPREPGWDDPRISPLLADVAVDSAEYRDLSNRFRDTEARLTDARARVDTEELIEGDLTVALGRLAGEANETSRRHDKAATQLDQLRSNLRELAVTSYVRGGIGSPVDAFLDLEKVGEQQRQRVMMDTVNQRELRDIAATAAVVDQTQAQLTTVTAELDDVRGRLSASTEARDQALHDGEAAIAERESLRPEVGRARLEAQVIGLGTGQGSEAGIGFQLVALDAYVKAATTFADERPDCGLRWQVIAGIGRIETAHGTYLGRHLAADGRISEDIIGIALDGSHDTAVITDTDGGRIDGDPVYDRAVGPMAFIPSAWHSLGRDGNGDGTADPQNMYDGALAAANLLCSRSSALDTEAGLQRAVFSYNPSNVYVDMVVGHIHDYDAFSLTPVDPAGTAPSGG